jgi:hypothetical protein
MSSVTGAIPSNHPDSRKPVAALALVLVVHATEELKMTW